MFVLKIVTDFASAHSLRDYPGDCSRSAVTYSE